MQKTRIRLLSDLHLELHDLSKSAIFFKKDADIVILAGDIGNPFHENYTNLIQMLSMSHEKVIIIAGNHEYYSSKSIEEINNKIKEHCEDDVHFLQKDTLTYRGIKFVGCTLWSSPSDVTLCKYMNDFHKIKDMTPECYELAHQSDKEWLRDELAKDDPNKVCVITHHLPSKRLVGAKYANDPMNSFFASDTFDDIDHSNVDVWCYGHTHIVSKNNISGVDFYCNPRGYSHESSGWNIDSVFEL